MSVEQYDLIVIGGGVAGLNVTSAAAQLGLKTALVERGPTLGGDCLHFGCVPSKTLIASARLANQVRTAERFGLSARLEEVDLARVMARVRAVVDEIQNHDSAERFRGLGAEVVLSARARFVSPGEVVVGERRMRAEHFVIATGSRPALPPVAGLAQAGFLTNETVFSLERLPARLLVLGGGAIGLELAQAFARLGSRVTVVEMLGRILWPEDTEVSAILERVLRSEGVELLTSATALAVTRDGPVRRVAVEHKGKRLELEADEILVATGRLANVDELDLPSAAVEAGTRGIKVDRRLRTTNKRVFACGDVVGPFQFTHMAEYQAGVVVQNLLFHLPRRVDYRVVPWVTFTDPELARVGLTEQQARERGLRFEVLRLRFADIDRALAEGEREGMAKVIAAKRRIVGATLLGPRAGELIHEFVLAMRARLGLRTIAETVHVYPTLAQITRRTINQHYAPVLFSERTRRLVRWLKWLPF